MAHGIDFILPSCPGIPDAMWVATSSMLDVIIKKCWTLFGVCLAIKFISDACLDIAYGKLELRTHIKTVFQALMIGLFLAYYKPLLMTFDRFIDGLCVFDEEALRAAIGKIEDRLPHYGQEKSIWKSSLLMIRSFLKLFFDAAPKLLGLLTHGGAVGLMHYTKVIALLITSHFGPLAALFSLLPGPFKRGFATWAKSYVHISCWTITINIFWVLTKAFSLTSLLLEEGVGHIFLSIVLFIAIFLTPTWTSKFIGGAITANIAAALSMASSRLGIGSKMAGKATKR